ncbi:hypothetical protein C0991_006498 [Blastosporella zonata]|nr:hypothetical protein C0991_006498 [Blastosporella zonata]
MGAGAVATGGTEAAYGHLIDPSRKWYNNRRYVFFNHPPIQYFLTHNVLSIVTLNAWVVLLLITSSTNGYDGSMMNGLQSLDQWKNYFNNPTGGKLGLLNAIQVRADFHIAAWTTYGTFKINSTWAWRVPSALQALPSVLQVCLIWFCPESPRYLISKGRDAEGLKILAYYHADGNDQDPLVRYEYDEIKAAIEFDRTVAANVGWKSLFTSSGNRKRLRIIIALAFFSQWSGNGLVSYYLNKVFDGIGITNPTTQLLINGILQIWNLGWALFASFMVDRIGRRVLFLTSASGMIIFYTLQTAMSGVFQNTSTEVIQPDGTSLLTGGNAGAAHSVIAFIFLYYAAYDLAFTPLIVSYTLEILPYPLRAKGFNVFNFAISLSLIFNQYVNPIALDALRWKYYVVYCCWLCFELVYLYFFVIETKNRTLEETAALFDGEDAVENVTGHTHAVAEKETSSFQENSAEK